VSEWQSVRPEVVAFGFSRLEAWLPRLFVGLYAVYLVGLLIAAVVGWL